MGNIKLTIATLLRIFIASCLFGYSINALANDGVPSNSATSERFKVEFTRDKDYKCTQCHKDSKHTLAGSHGQNVIDKIGKEVNCTDCHSNIGPDHRDGASTVTKYSDAQSQAGTDKHQLPTDQILKANSMCTDCHTPERLQKANWTHDVHAKNLTCTNCHTVHATDAKVLSFDRKAKIGTCVDCHSDINHQREE
ncbi:cytochrome c nitrite reductase pentaheme subunit [Vibrio sp. UCD-FRSSP16_10]|uniref:cytochrome c nitrite reductase pentaheme subunit n=1 Tax=unclassified Vibrio TaxID=2614977 RepID=UPI0007FF408C|nr:MULTISPECIES: cytochrome c nitrite reductase pentaheme subunit [unclassified Vibrio]OBT13251.1 cytochrome c nitrite reductase pentaheme subunit [Vibrio sp. UCD-FRSSP16_30]OBT19601.1 cytochrome c nitrite reductase pentaheme subunit [Vibrio sp. UCD-FRSSP16_10]